MTQPSGDLPNRFISLRDDWKPMTVPSNVWNEVWENFIGFLGPTMGDVEYRVSKVATAMSMAGHRTSDVTKIAEYLVAVTEGYLTGRNKLLRIIPGYFWVNCELTEFYARM